MRAQKTVIWIFINSIALTYKPEYKESYRQFIIGLPNILPCKTCGENLKKNIQNLDIALESKENLLNWLINVRNGIYIDNGEAWKQKNMKETFDEIFSTSTYNSNMYWWLLFSIIILVVLFILLYVEKNLKKN